MRAEMSLDNKESYGSGLRRRLRTASVVVGTFLVAGANCYFVLAATGSVAAMLGTGVVAGYLAEVVGQKIDPLPGAIRTSESERLIWLVLFGPVIVVLLATLTFFLINPPENAELVGAAGISILLGDVIAATRRVLRMKAQS